MVAVRMEAEKELLQATYDAKEVRASSPACALTPLPAGLGS